MAYRHEALIAYASYRTLPKVRLLQLRHALCNVKRSELTDIPTVNAPNAPTMGSYGKDESG